jgi:hypothetical protein
MPKAFLLCLLVLLVPVDDAWARATPGPDDDAAAAENDDFLIPAATEVAPAQDVAPAPGAVRVPDDFAVPPWVAVPAPSTLFRRPLLYLLLSLRR